VLHVDSLLRRGCNREPRGLERDVSAALRRGGVALTGAAADIRDTDARRRPGHDPVHHRIGID